MALVHWRDFVAAAQAAHRDVAVGPVPNAEGADLGGSEAETRRFLMGVPLVPEGGAGGDELVGNGEGRRR